MIRQLSNCMLLENRRQIQDKQTKTPSTLNTPIGCKIAMSSFAARLPQESDEHMKVDHAATYEFEVSIVVVSFNTCDVLRECLLSVYREAGSMRVQVIVVDNASIDGSAEMIEREFPEVELIRNKINLGFGPANNLGFKSVRGHYVVLLNSDAFLTEGSLRRSVEHMDENPRAGLGGGRLIGRDGSWQPSARMFPTVLIDLIVHSGLAARFPRSRFFGRADRTWADEMEAAEVDWVPGAYSHHSHRGTGNHRPLRPAFFPLLRGG